MTTTAEERRIRLLELRDEAMVCTACSLAENRTNVVFGYGDPDATPADCERSAADDVADNTDCDDTKLLVYPDADIFPADGIDQNCDGMEECFRDGDGDGLGIDEGALDLDGDIDCTTGVGVTTNGDDINDAASSCTSSWTRTTKRRSLHCCGRSLLPMVGSTITRTRWCSRSVTCFT